ncbi:hypothetical protein [Ferrimonas balearica]|nr:hypothetical protein [Ferrimonas balearica]MBW3139204.1 hypothetical protein [Ferrimonas balearica]MBW3163207.1 hypothetical protein [Ferrimonas balearica]MBY5980900.1 hypothetical protein [Ferrimonas balearica]MBY6106268.1 hypothetical protein [Ferrimonas balearica]MBY6223153.1 hypothetical protein [Ferrimonas balearica]
MNRWGRAMMLGASVGILLACGLALLMALWDWWENPGGIFRSDRGTQWHFVWDTFISWFAPTTLSFGLTGAGVMMARQWWRQY